MPEFKYAVIGGFQICAYLHILIAYLTSCSAGGEPMLIGSLEQG